jgi:transposase
MTGRIEVVAHVSGRQYWTVEQKLGMLRDAFGSGGSVRAAIERHEISSGLFYTWRKQAMSGALTGIAPVAALPDFAGSGSPHIRRRLQLCRRRRRPMYRAGSA